MILWRGGKEAFLFHSDTAPLRDYEHRAKGTIVIMNDVTERTRLEAELYHNPYAVGKAGVPWETYFGRGSRN